MNLQILAAILAVVASQFKGAQTDAAAVAPKLQVVNTGLADTSAILAALPESTFKDDAVKALNIAGTAVATAIVVAHTVEAAPVGNNG